MSLIPALNTVLSLLSFLTVIFALARVGAAAFSANQGAPSDSASATSPSSSRPVSPEGGTHTHRSWHLSNAAHLLQLQLTGGSPTGAGNGKGMSSIVRFGPSTPSLSIPMDFAQAIRYGLVAADSKWKSSGSREREVDKTIAKQEESERERGRRDEGEKMDMVEYVGGHELVRMPATTWTGSRRPGLLFRPPSPFPDQTQPLSMAKLIMSRHQNQRRPSRPPSVRRPPGLPASPTSRSRLVEEV